MKGFILLFFCLTTFSSFAQNIYIGYTEAQFLEYSGFNGTIRYKKISENDSLKLFTWEDKQTNTLNMASLGHNLTIGFQTIMPATQQKLNTFLNALTANYAQVNNVEWKGYIRGRAISITIGNNPSLPDNTLVTIVDVTDRRD